MTIENKFEFRSVSSNFKEHISNSIRGYGDLHRMIANISRFFLCPDGGYIDIGSSDGSLAKLVASRTGCTNIICYEKEETFHTNENYKGFTVLSDALLMDFIGISFVTSVFTLQFIQKSKRLEILHNIYKALEVGGGFVLAEKVVFCCELDTMFQDILLQDKRQFFTDTEILDKNLMLQNTMKCLSLKDIKEMLYMVGFKDVTVFWQNGLFVAILCRKGVL